MKINQYCSVCKKHLDMEVIPTDDEGGDDGVIWLRCPDCQGFLPKFTGEGLKSEPTAPEPAATSSTDPAESPPAPEPTVVAETPARVELPADIEKESRAKAKAKAEEPEAPAEPVAEYAALLAAADPASARPYRPSSEYAVGDVVHHLAYDDIGIVVAKETLPGGRQVVKVFFDEAGVVHLIEQAADGR